MSKLDNTNTPAPANLFRPSEIIGILRNHLATGQVNQRVVCLRGIYFKGSYVNQYFHTATDRLVDESTSDELSLSMPLNLRDNLENGNVITVHGILDRSITNKGLIQIVLKVTEVEMLKELAVSEDEIKRTELRRIKSEKGFKNVDSLLESLLYQDKRPQIALVYAETSITNDDFEKGVQAARTHIDFKEYRVSFAKTKAFCQTLKQLDAMNYDVTMNYDVIAIIRGGGAGLEALDEVELLETLVNMNTAWMYGAGHEGEKLFILNIADKAIAIPHALGTYFRDITDGVVQKRNNSRAALVKEVEGQFKKLEALQKQNKAQTEASNKKIEELTKAQKEHEKVVKAMTEEHKKATEEANKLHKTQNESLQKANTQLQEQLKTQGKTLTDLQEQTKKQQEEMNKSLGKMQEANNQLQKNLATITTQNTESLKQLAQAKEHAKDLEHKLSDALNNRSGNSNIWMVIAIVAIIILIVSFFIK